MTIGYSLLFDNLVNITEGYEQSRQALRYALKNMNSSVDCGYEDLGLLRFVISEKNKNALIDYCNKLIEPIAIQDQTEHTNYVETLWTFLENGNNYVKTAQVLYVHRNTLVNRIGKIEELLNIDLGNVGVRNTFFNAFTVLKFYGCVE